MSSGWDQPDPYFQASQEDRSAARIAIAIPAQLRISGSRPFQTVVNGLSLSGFSAASLTRLHPGAVCWLTIPGLETLTAQVVWWEDNQCGCLFQNLLSPVVYENIRMRWSAGGTVHLL